MELMQCGMRSDDGGLGLGFRVLCMQQVCTRASFKSFAQRSCFNLPAYAWIREGPDHATRFKGV
jgi:hypothetical protein